MKRILGKCLRIYLKRRINVKEIIKEIKKLRRESEFAYVSSVDGEGYPQIKAMFAVHEKGDIREHYFSTNTSSARAAQFRADPKASVYLCDTGSFKGALFTGTMEVLTDRNIKAELWQEGNEMYYPGGIDDEDYCILKFTAQKVNYYHGLQNVTLSIEDLEEE